MTAVSVNFLPVTLGGTVSEIIVLAVLHFDFIARMRFAQTAARGQRELDFERFRRLAATPAGAGSSTVL